MGVNKPVVPEDGGLKLADGLIDITTAQKYPAEQKVAFGTHRFTGKHAAKCSHRVVVTAVFYGCPGLGKQLIGSAHLRLYVCRRSTAKHDRNKIFASGLLDAQIYFEDGMRLLPLLFKGRVTIPVCQKPTGLVVHLGRRRI